MILIYLIFFGSIFMKRINKLSPNKRRIFYTLFALYLIFMLLYEIYVEFFVHWEYGVPFDDDTGWIFRSANALHMGTPINKLYLLVQRSYDTENRALTFNNLGQYFYMLWVYLGMYFPKVFNIRINLYLLYTVQSLMVFIAAIDLESVFEKILFKNKDKSKIPYWWFILIFLFTPIIQYNAYKLLREIWYIYVMIEVMYMTVNIKTKKDYIYIFALIILATGLRAFSLLLTVPFFLYYGVNKKIGKITNLSLLFMLFVGTNILFVIMRLFNDNYIGKNVDFEIIVHLLFFPNVFNQFKNLLLMFKQPSWVTLLYFTQSVWNVIIMPLAALGIVFGKKIKEDYFFWLVMLVNTSATYSLVYRIESITPRYKLVFLIPLLYFVMALMGKLKEKCKIVLRG